MDIKFNLIELLDKIDKLDDKYAFIHIICLVLPVIIIFNCVRKIIRKILGFIFRIIFFCFYGNDDDEEQESLLQKKPYEESNYNKSNEKELDITDFSPSLSSSKKNKKKKKKSNSNKSSPKISREYLYSTINENIKDEIEYYNPETPGYPYYPPIKYWKQNFETKGGQPPRHEEWLKMVKSIFVETNKSKGIIVRINFPYSESLNHLETYNKAFINENHEKVEPSYVKGILGEWNVYRKAFGIVAQPKIKSIQLEGTPSYFSPVNLNTIIDGVILGSDVISKNDFVFVGHPTETTEEHLKVLKKYGFKRLKIRIYDFAQNVLQAINRPNYNFNNVNELIKMAKDNGFNYIHLECMYNLPKQTIGSLNETLKSIIELEPNQISLKRYEFIDWNGQSRNFSSVAMPEEEDIRPMHLMAIQLLNKSGYTCLGLDEYFKITDNNPLIEAKKKGQLQYSSIGFLVNKNIEKDNSERYKSNKRLILGLGIEAISDIYYAYAMNTRSVRDWLSNVLEKDKLAFSNGQELSQNDELIRGAIWQFLCEGRIKISKLLIRALSFETFSEIKEAINRGILGLDGSQIKKDGVIVLDGDEIWIKDKDVKIENDFGRKSDLLLPGLCQLLDNTQYRKKRRN
ncbi:radical SAM enzyme [Neocallimastix californiae]|uniref:Radical SAM enzyme n=1 Tax=Neocallimastix californiae TaxID=1754190 RepID=A0A1Y2E5I9_9FUNG|nr:radical SAM enzyme [Neocallimastix californiae]|eukprot:ORY66838.1 radical SAM enzyme [Neocallimastix californiae]